MAYPKQTHCPKGHPYNEVNTYVNPNTGKKLCRTCGKNLKQRGK